MDPKEKDRYEQSVKEFLSSSETSVESCWDLFWRMKAEWDEAGKKAGKWATYGIIMVFLFVLLSRGLIASASFSGIQVNRLTFVLYFLPPAVVLCVVNVMALITEQSHYGYIMAELAKQKLSGLATSGLAALLTSSYGLMTSDIPKEFTTRRGRINDALYLWVQFILALMGPLVFEVLAYMHLFGNAKYSTTGVLLSSLAAAALVIVIVLRFIEWFSDPYSGGE